MKNIPLAKPLLGEEEIEAVSDILRSGWITQGPKVQEFEQDFSIFAGARYACAVSSCTAALHIALLTVGVKPGDVVITVSHSFIATANAIRHCHAEPVFIDIDSETLNMSPTALKICLEQDFQERGGELWYKYTEKIAQGYSPLRSCKPPVGRLAAVLVVHQVGMPAPLAPILELTGKYGLPVVEDAACAIGSEISLNNGITWDSVGRPHGDISCFSFHPRKLLTTGDGGMLTTNSEAYDSKFRLYRQHGMTLSDRDRHMAHGIVFEEYSITGYNYRMTDIQAAIGIAQLRRIPEMVRKRRLLAAQYSQELSNQGDILTPREPSWAKTNWQSYVVRLGTSLVQKHVMQALKKQGIQSRRGVMCAHLEQPYCMSWPKGSLPNSEKAQREGLILPLYPQMSSADVEYVVHALTSLNS